MANDVKLQSPEGIHPVDENLRPLFIGEKQSAIETAQHGDGAKITGDLEVTGDIMGNITDITFDSIALNSITNATSGEAITMTPGTSVIIDKNLSETTASTLKALHVDLDRTGDVSSGLDMAIGIDIDVNHTGASAGTITSTGADICVAGDSGGTSSGYGVILDVASADTCWGLYMEVAAGSASTSNGIYIKNTNGGTDLKIISSASSNDYFTLNTIEDGETTLTTVEAGGGSTAHLNMVADGDFTVDAAGDISLDAAGGDVTILQADLTIPSDKGLKSGTMTLSASELDKAGGDFTIDVEGDLILDANGGNITLLDDGGRYVPTAASDAVPLGYLPFVLYSQFQDDLGTSKHYLPLKGYFEQSFVGNEPAGMIAPFALTLQKIVMRCSEDISGADWKIGMWAIDSGTTHSHHHTSGFNWIQVTGGAADTNAVFDFTGTVGLAAVGSGGSNAVTAGQWIDFQIFADTDVTSSSAEFWITIYFTADLSSTV